VVFKGGILGGARQFWGNPYSKSMTKLFDTNYIATNVSNLGIVHLPISHFVVS